MDYVPVSTDACNIVHAVHHSAVGKLRFRHRQFFQWTLFACGSFCALSIPGHKPVILTGSF